MVKRPSLQKRTQRACTPIKHLHNMNSCILKKPKHSSSFCSISWNLTKMVLLFFQCFQFLVAFVCDIFWRQIRRKPFDAISWRQNTTIWFCLLTRQSYSRHLVTQKRNRCFIKSSVLDNEYVNMNSNIQILTSTNRVKWLTYKLTQK